MSHWDNTGYVCSSKYRMTIVKFLLMHRSTPHNIAENTNIKMPHVSRALRQLKEKGIVECLTPYRSRGRIYKLTTKGVKIAKMLEKEIV